MIGRNDVLIVLPKLESYMHKESRDKSGYLTSIQKWVEVIKEGNRSLMCLAEDDLAHEIIEDKVDTWLSVVNNTADEYYLESNVVKRECVANVEKCDAKHYNKVVVSMKLKKPAEFESIELYKKMRWNNMLGRIRGSANVIIQEKTINVIQFIGTSNWVGKVEQRDSDGKGICIVDWVTGTTELYIGGLKMEEHIFKKYIGG